MNFVVAYWTDLAAGLLAAAAVVVAANLVWTGPRTRLVVPLLAAGLAAVAVRGAVVGWMASLGWDFVARRVILDVPLAAVPTAVALGVALRARATTGRRLAITTAAAGTSLAALDQLLLTGWLVTVGLLAVALLGPALTLALLSDARGPVRWTATAAAALLALAVVVPLATSWWGSRLPGSFDLADYAPADDGGGPGGHAGHNAGGTSVDTLTGPRGGEPDVHYTLTASPLTVRTGSRTVQAVAFNGTVPGPQLEAREGDLVQVDVCNRGDRQGVTVHWHGVDVPNAEDGVAGVTQPVIRDGQCHTYRFRTEQAGTFWYHAHQASDEQVDRGLFGALVFRPTTQRAVEGMDLTVLDHAWRPPGGFLAGASWDAADAVERRPVPAGTPVRLRIVNTTNTPRSYRLAGTPFTLAAVDGGDLTGGAPVTRRSLTLAAGGRYDITFTMPGGPVALSGLADGVRAVLGSGTPPATSGSWPALDLLTYGRRGESPPEAQGPYDRDFRLVMDRKIAFAGGRPTYAWAVNGLTFPRMPMQMVREGDLVRIRFVNRSTADHPMHIHGHHLLVLSRNGKPATGAPWFTDTLNVAPGEDYAVAFRADNPGIWMDHCHNLQHAAVGFVMHLGYEGVTSPYRIGSDTGNNPE